MNIDQIQGIAKNLTGIVQEAGGKLLGSKNQEIKGIQKQVLGRAERFIGDSRAIIKNAQDAIKYAAG